MSIRLVIFDIDGTLVDSQRTIVSCGTMAFEACGLEPPAPEAIRRIVGLSLLPAMQQLLGYEDEPLARRISEAYRDAYLRYRERADYNEAMFDGARELLQDLTARELILGVATGKAMRGLHAIIERYDLHGLFVTLQTADIHPSKPHPAMLEAALAETGSVAGDAVFVGDTTFDIEMARQARVLPIGVAWGNHPAAELEAAGAHRVLRQFGELLDILDRS